MIQRWFVNGNGRQVLYGADKPTGGFFFTEFYNDEELVSNYNNDVATTESSMPLTVFISRLYSSQKKTLTYEEICELINDWVNETNPTKLQYNISSLFGVNLQEMLAKTEKDLEVFIRTKNK